MPSTVYVVHYSMHITITVHCTQCTVVKFIHVMSISSCRKSKAMPFYVKHSMSAESTKNYINSYVMLMPQNVSALVQYVNSLIYFLAKEFLLVFVLPSASCMKRLKKGLTLIKGAWQPLPAIPNERLVGGFSPTTVVPSPPHNGPRV